MTEERREQIKNIVNQFRRDLQVASIGTKPTNKEVVKYCQKMNYEPVGLGDLEDYTVQIQHDERVTHMLPLILSELQNLRYVPEFADVKVRKEIEDSNDAVRIKVVDLLETQGFPYHLLDRLGQEIGGIIGGIVHMAGTTALNRMFGAMLLMAKEKYGENFNSADAARYIKEVNEPKEK